MPRAAPLQSSFALGEVSPLVYARTDNPKRKEAVALCQNFVPLVQGPLTRRGGTKFVAEVKDSNAKTWLLPFEFSNTQAYVLEFGDQYVRFFSQHGVVGGPLEVVTPYRTADLPSLRITQSADVLYLFHKSYAPRTLTRVSALVWTLALLNPTDGPYLAVNATSTTITPSGTGGVITLTASAAIFTVTDIGRNVRLKIAGVWGWCRITAYTDTTHVTATVYGGALGGTTATSTWRLGLYCDTLGYPSCGTFFEDRLVMAGHPAAPQRFDGSNTADYTNMSPSDSAGAVTASHAVSYTLIARQANPVFWLVDNDKGLVAGAYNGEFLVRPSTNSEAMSPTNVSAKMATGNGSANVAAVELDKSVVYVGKTGRKLHDFFYDVNVENYRSPDISVIGEHMTQSGVVQLAAAKTPQPMVWGVRGDGQLVGMTYNKDDHQQGWHRQILGGYSDTDRTLPAVVESIAVIPEPNGQYDEVWMIVRRVINGITKRYVEYMTKFWETNDQLVDAFYVDCGLTYSGTAATVIGGLSHLAFETVDILADGARHPPLQVDATGTITLRNAASKVQVGLPMTSVARMLPTDAGAADGTALAKTRRVDHVGFWFMDTVGGKYGDSMDTLNLFLARSDQDLMDNPPPLFSGQVTEPWDGDYTFDDGIYVVQDAPFPMTLLAIAPRLVEYDAG